VTRRAALALAVCLVPLLGTGSASAKAPSSLRLAAPSPGHVTVQLLALNVRAKHPGRLAKRVGVRFARPGKLPPSVRVLTATRSIRTRAGRRYALLAIVFNKAGASGSRAAAHSAGERRSFVDLLIYGTAEDFPCPHCTESVPEDELKAYGGLCRQCHLKGLTVEKGGVRDVDTTTGPGIDLFQPMLMRDWYQSGGEKTAFEEPHPALDTGHYDDGHAFGWNRKTVALETDVVKDLGLDQPQKIVSDSEIAGAFDLNGDGQVGGQPGTIIGPPVIT
jgi:hypothetical protein